MLPGLRLCLLVPVAGVCRLLVLARSLEVADYVSEEYFPGMHLLDVGLGGIRIYKDCQRPENGAPIVVPADWETMAAARAALESALGILPPEPLQTPWAIFDAQGTRLEKVEALLDLRVAFLLEIGVWMWPAVRVGFVQEAAGVLQGKPLRLKTLSLRPVVFEVEGFIQHDEADKVIGMGKKMSMFKSKGMLESADKVSKRAQNEYRTSTQAWLRKSQSPVIDALDRRTANLTRVPREHNEEVQLLNYAAGQFYSSHLDWTDLTLYNGQRAQWTRSHFGWQDRLATLFWYLNDVSEGGQTVFPRAGSVICPGLVSNCRGVRYAPPKACNVGLQVQPRKGSVILWYNHHPNGRGDHNALHGGCPPAGGLEKWSGNKWINIKPLRSPPPKWMDDHPALRRSGWNENALEELAQGKTVTEDPKVARSLSVTNGYSSADTVKLAWIDPVTKQATDVAEVPRDEEVQVKSWLSHQFVVAHGQQRSKPFTCGKGSSSFRVGPNLVVSPVSPSAAGSSHRQEV